MLQLSLEKKPSQHFSKKLARITHIQNIQADLRACDVDHLNQKIGYLNQTYIIHLVALWQVFNEDLAHWGFNILHRRSALGSLTLESLYSAKRRFKTPNTQKIDLLFKTALNIERISESWEWDGVTRDYASALLASVLKARHEIAHLGGTASELDYDKNYAAMVTIYRMACEMEMWLESQLAARSVQPSAAPLP